MLNIKMSTMNPVGYYISQGKKIASIDESKDLMPQVDKILEDITVSDYNSYIEYLKANGETEAVNQLIQSGMELSLSNYLYEFVDHYTINSKICGRLAPFTFVCMQQHKDKDHISVVSAILKRIIDIAYAKILCTKNIQGDLLLKLMSVRKWKSAGKLPKIEQKTDNYTLTYDYGKYNMLFNGKKEVTVTYTNMNPGAKLVLLMLTIELAKIIPYETFSGRKQDFMNYADIEITTDKYMEYTQKKDKKNANKILDEYLNDLYESKIIAVYGTETKEVDGKKKRVPLGIKGRWIENVDNTKKRRGIYRIMFSYSFMQWICSKKAKMHDFNTSIFLLSDKQSTEINLGFKLWHNYMSRQGESGYDVLTVPKLLYIDGLPFMEDVTSNRKDMHLTAKYKKPIEKALETLVNIGFLSEWHYEDEKGNVVKDTNKDFTTWLKWKLRYKLLLPPQNKYITAHIKSKAQALKQKEYRRIKKQEKIEKSIAKSGQKPV